MTASSNNRKKNRHSLSRRVLVKCYWNFYENVSGYFSRRDGDRSISLSFKQNAHFSFHFFSFRCRRGRFVKTPKGRKPRCDYSDSFFRPRIFREDTPLSSSTSSSLPLLFLPFSSSSSSSSSSSCPIRKAMPDQLFSRPSRMMLQVYRGLGYVRWQHASLFRVDSAFLFRPLLGRGLQLARESSKIHRITFVKSAEIPCSDSSPPLLPPPSSTRLHWLMQQ